MTKIEQIFYGWARYSFALLGFKPTKEQAELAEHRLIICDSCEKRTENRCKICGCNLAAKTLVKEAKCPINNGNK
jgi:hypothetical protein